MPPWLLLSALLPGPSLAGDVVLTTTVPAEVHAGAALLVRTWGPARLQIQALTPGLQPLRVVRGERTDTVEVLVPDSGPVGLSVDAKALAAGPAPALPEGPVLELRASVGQRFGVVVDGQRVAVVGHSAPVRLVDLQPGPHHLELRTADLTVVWARADLELLADDLLVVTGQEGYAPLVSGREGAFRLAGAATPRGGAEAPAAPPPSPPAGG